MTFTDNQRAVPEPRIPLSILREDGYGFLVLHSIEKLQMKRNAIDCALQLADHHCSKTSMASSVVGCDHSNAAAIADA